MASISTEGSSSYRVARTSRSMCRSTAGIRAWGAKPVNRTGPASGRAWASAARRPGPSPTMSRQADPVRRLKALISVPTSFCGAIRPM